MKIAIIDYGMGNLFSVQHACRFVGLEPIVTSDSSQILSSEGAILPGVGAFGRAMTYLKDLGLVETIKAFIHTGKPFMGICLGMQLLFSESEEFGATRGLDIIKGQVLKFPSQHNGEMMKIPQISWNRIHKKLKDDASSPLNGVRDNEFMYFVHSYYAQCQEKDIVSTTTKYAGVEYCSSILKDNIFATQFHPEKSADKGIHIYKNWAMLIKTNP